MDDYANLDYDRAERCGFPEVIYGASKTPEQICTIATQLLERHGVVMATRVGADAARIVQGTFRTHAGSSARGCSSPIVASISSRE